MQRINLIYGSVYGTAHYIVRELQTALSTLGHLPQLLEQPTLQQLNSAHPLLIVTSTTGQGALPARLQPLLLALQSPSVDISGLKYALIGLGDSSYARYCGGALALAHAMDSCGAVALAPMLRLDACHCINPEDQALPWALKLIEEHT